MKQTETYISIDVETAGPNPGHYSMLSIGACLVTDPTRTFYVELQPVNDSAQPQAMQVSGLALAYLAEHGTPPAEAMTRFETWVHDVTPPEHRPVFVAFNAPFDWMFVCEYFHRYLGRNPFGHSALDLKAVYMGLTGVTWRETSMAHVAARYLDNRALTHNALHDAQDQAEIMRKMLVEQQNIRSCNLQLVTCNHSREEANTWKTNNNRQQRLCRSSNRRAVLESKSTKRKPYSGSLR